MALSACQIHTPTRHLSSLATSMSLARGLGFGAGRDARGEAALGHKAGLRVGWVLLHGRWRLPKLHLAGEVLKIGDHGEGQAKVIGEKVLSWNLCVGEAR